MNRLLLYSLVALILSACRDHPSPSEPVLENPPSPLSLHGTWRASFPGQGTRAWSFDTSNHSAIQLIDYSYQFYREFEFQYTTDRQRLFVASSSGDTTSYWHVFHAETLLICQDSAFSFPVRYLRSNPQPALGGWFTGTSWTMYREIGDARNFVMGFGVSDSGWFVLTDPLTGSGPTTLLRIDSNSTVVSSIDATGIRALDAVDQYLWTATDTTIDQRNVADLSIIKTIKVGALLRMDSPDYHVAGLAVGDGELYLAHHFTSQYGTGLYARIHRLTFDGIVSLTPLTCPAIRDMALVNNRLFCVAGSETFYELNIFEGTATSTYFVQGYKNDVNLSGIAFHHNHLHLANDRWFALRLFETIVP